MLIRSATASDGWSAIAWVLLLVVSGVSLFGLTIVNPNQAKVVQVFGTYVGSLKQQGLRWVNPLSTRRRVSLRIRNFESSKLKVNDQDGNPIEIAAVVVWRVIDTAEAMFMVDDYEHFLHVQASRRCATWPPAIRTIRTATREMSLRMSVIEIAHKLRDEIQERLTTAGIEVIEARITHLAYAAGDRQRDAAPAAGQRHHRGPPEDRGGRRRHGGDGARPC